MLAEFDDAQDGILVCLYETMVIYCNTPYLITCISHCYMCWSVCIDPKLGIYEFKYEY